MKKKTILLRDRKRRTDRGVTVLERHCPDTGGLHTVISALYIPSSTVQPHPLVNREVQKHYLLSTFGMQLVKNQTRSSSFYLGPDLHVNISFCICIKI